MFGGGFDEAQVVGQDHIGVDQEGSRQVDGGEAAQNGWVEPSGKSNHF